MRCLVAATLLLIVSRTLLAAERTATVDIKPTVDKGLAFLVKDALAWKKEHNCISCHHAALVVWSMHEAKQHGFTVDEPVLAELTKWSAESVGPGTVGVPRPPSAPKGLNTKAVFFALGFSAVPTSDATVQKAMPALLQTMKTDQMEGGSWQSWPDTRPPIFGHSDELFTILESLALVPAASAGDQSVVAARDKGVKWLAEHPTGGDLQNVAMRLVLWKKLDRPFDEWHPLAKRILEKQNADGGWSQSPEMASDAWATGQALYALSYAGLKSDDPAIQRGHTFLVKTQREDGGWAMTSRPTKPGGAGSTSLIPITGAGSAWAVLGLVRSK